jgi:DNA polymerase III sliding clamp (beta) subunit (PCNA family)
MLLKTIEKMPEEDENIFIETDAGAGKTNFYNATQSRNFSFSTIYADMVYRDANIQWESMAKTSSDIWLNLLKKAIPCTSDDELKQAMMCIRLESEKNGDNVTFRSVATDAHCLCINHESTEFFTGDTNLTALLPKEAITAILPHLNGAGLVELQECTAKYCFRFVSAAGIQTEILFRKLDAKFPDYKNVIPNIAHAKAGIICNRKSMIDTMKRAGIYANNTTHLSKFTFNYESGLITIESEDMNYSYAMEEKINAGFRKLNADLPNVFEIGLNAKLFSRILNLLDCEEITIYYYSDKSAILMEDANNSFEDFPFKEHVLQQRFLLMPIMLNY